MLAVICCASSSAAATAEPSFTDFIHMVLGPAQRAELDRLMGWSRMTDAQRMRHFADCERRPERRGGADPRCPVLDHPAPDAYPALLQLQTGKPWRSRFKFQSKILTEDQMKDSITRVQRWDGLMLDPQAAWRSGFVNASAYYEEPYILGYTGATDVVGFRPKVEATSVATDVIPPFEFPALAVGSAVSGDEGGSPQDTDTAGAVSTSFTGTDDATAGGDVSLSTDGSTQGPLGAAVAMGTSTDGGPADEAQDTATAGGDGSATDTDTATAVSTSTAGLGAPPIKLDDESTQEDLMVNLGDVTDAYYTPAPPICLLEVPPSARCQLLLARARNLTRPNASARLTEAYAYDAEPAQLYDYGTFEHPRPGSERNTTTAAAESSNATGVGGIVSATNASDTRLRTYLSPTA